MRYCERVHRAYDEDVTDVVHFDRLPCGHTFCERCEKKSVNCFIRCPEKANTQRVPHFAMQGLIERLEVLIKH